MDYKCLDTFNDKWLIESFFKGKKNGFFIEAGGADGKNESSTYILEKHFGWNGIIVEPCDEFYEKLIRNRTSKCVCAALSDKDGFVSFITAANDKYLSGIEQNISEWHREAVFQEGFKKRQVESISIKTLLKRYNCPSVIDLIHFDMEGSELSVIKEFPFDEYLVKLFIIEISDRMIKDELLNNGFLEVNNQFNTKAPWECYFINSKILNL